MTEEKYLVIFGAVIFGLSASYYLVSWAHLIDNNKFVKEWKFTVWAFPFFLLTLLDWFINYEVVAQIDNTVWFYLSGFVSTGIYFVLSVIINPRKTKNAGWKHVKTRIRELIYAGTFIVVWGFAIKWIYGLDLVVHYAWTIPPFLFLILWYLFKKEWVGWLYLGYIYMINIVLLIELT